MSRAKRAVLVAAVAFLGLAAAPAAAVHAAPPLSAPSAAASAACGDTSQFREVALSSLPPQVTDTVRRIQSGGPFPYPRNDGAVFQNREGILPACSSGYYHEYTVITPGSSTRGARRIITGRAAEYFYTADHYAGFVLVDIYS